MIAAMVGIDTRSTMDMDATIKGIPVTKETITEMFEEICKIKVEDDVGFTFEKIGEIREGDEYSGYRITLIAAYPPMNVPLKLDITTRHNICLCSIPLQISTEIEGTLISPLRVMH